MTIMIILTDAEAERVRGVSPTDPQAALEPIPVPGGLWMLPLAVLDDPAHVTFREFLAARPREDIPLSVPFEDEESDPGG